jgi:lipopolysaccharide export system permease protein
MMTLLDRYILRHFFLPLLLSLSAFAMIFVIVDLVDRLDTFLDRGASTATIVSYYLYYIPYTVALTLPMAMLLASLFTLGGLNRTNEITAMKAAGVGLYRIFTPILIVGLLVSCLAFVFNETVVPWATAKRMAIKRATRPGYYAENRYDILLKAPDGRIVFAKYYNAEGQSAHNVSIETEHDGQIVTRTTARRMVWEGGRWMMHDVEQRMFRGMDEHVEAMSSLVVGDLGLVPQDFARLQKSPDEMNYTELNEYIRRIVLSGQDATRQVVDLNLKIAFPLTNFIIVLFGAPLSSGVRRTGKAVSFGISLLISFLYFFCIKTGQVLGWYGFLPPMLSAWLGNIVFGIIALTMFIKVRK